MRTTDLAPPDTAKAVKGGVSSARRWRRRRPSLRWAERTLRVAGWVALAWVSWGWLDARLYQEQQERLFSEGLAVARLERLADERGAASGVRAWEPGTGPLAGATVEIAGAGPARILVPAPAERAGQVATQERPAAPAKEETTDRVGSSRERTEAPRVAEIHSSPAAQRTEASTSPAASSVATRRSLPGDDGWSGSAVTGSALARLAVRRLGLGVMVAPGVDSRSLRRAAGHIPGTAPPGGEGNVGIAGHRDTFFRPLRGIVVGDEIELTTAAGIARYEVEWTRVVSPEQVDVLAPTPYPALTLVTCYPFTWVGHAPERFIVRARLIERAAG